jgi:hypothetical protein
MTTQKIPHCFCCSYIPPNNTWIEVARHTASEVSKKGTQTSRIHRKLQRWASKVIAGNTIKNRVEFKPVSKDPDKESTEYGDDNRANRKVQLSGEFHNALCFCPHCKRPHGESLPVEFLELEHLWLIENKPVVLCGSCKR